MSRWVSSRRRPFRPQGEKGGGQSRPRGNQHHFGLRAGSVRLARLQQHLRKCRSHNPVKSNPYDSVRSVPHVFTQRNSGRSTAALPLVKTNSNSSIHTPLLSVNSAISFVEYVVSMPETLHVRPRQEGRPDYRYLQIAENRREGNSFASNCTGLRAMEISFFYQRFTWRYSILSAA